MLFRSHRWRYASVTTPIPAPFLAAFATVGGRVRGLGACGDAFADPARPDAEGAERALASAVAVAGDVMGGGER